MGPHGLINSWIERGYFTAHSLFYKLARRLAGFEEYDAPGTDQQTHDANTLATREIWQYFEALLELKKPLEQRQVSGADPTQLDSLVTLLQRINTFGDSGTNKSIHTECRNWINEFYPETEQRLARLQTGLEVRRILAKESKRKRRSDPSDDEFQVDTLESLAYRLQFALTAALLDYHTHIVFYEWQNKPSSVDGEMPHRRMPTTMLDVLPLPPNGRQFGTYYAPPNKLADAEATSSNLLSLFAYTNIGRWYVLNFHRLLTDLDGCPGPNVLALSGTSYLPHSTQMHVSKPGGVLMPEESASSAIESSLFRFLPQYEPSSDLAIRVSGQSTEKKHTSLRTMMSQLAGTRGQLNQELAELRRLGDESQDQWGDRARLLLLVNSYQQAQWAADAVRRSSGVPSDKIYHLVRAQGDLLSDDSYADRPQAFGPGTLLRSDIESFAATGGSILVAPLGAIGRGFNILNSRGKAAFGAAYFLTRPFPYPHDVAAIAREMNYRALEWAEDPSFIAWQKDGIAARAEELRRQATFYWQMVEQRSFYHTLHDDTSLRAFPRKDLAATTVGLVMQAVGRLIRGGVPFHAYFVDAAWASRWADKAEKETPRTSLLAAMIDVLSEYVDTDPIGQALYDPLATALLEIKDFEWQPDKRDKEQ